MFRLFPDGTYYAELAAELLELQRESAADEFEKQDTESDDSDDELSVQEHQEEQNTLTMGRGIMPSTSARDILLKSATSSTKRLLLSRTDSSNTDVGGSASSLSSSSKVQAPPAPPASLPSAPPQPLPTAHATAAGPCAPQDLPPQPPIGGANDVVPKRVAVTDPKDALITAQPEMLACTLTAEDEFVLLACDGLFDVFSSEEVRDCGQCYRWGKARAENKVSKGSMGNWKAPQSSDQRKIASTGWD